MVKSILIASCLLLLATPSAFAAKNTEVYNYEKFSEKAMSALRSKNYDVAFKYLDKASKLGNKEAQYSLALLYMGGLGVAQDYAQAYLWLNVASEAKEKKWRQLRDKIRNALTGEQQQALKPHVEDYISKFGAKTQEISCARRAATGSSIRKMKCVKRLDIGSPRLD